jgi:hypothetical protein
MVEDLKQKIESSLEQVLQQVAMLAQNTINEYIEELEMSMGVTSPKLGWAPLHEGDTKFWYKTGAVASHIIASIKIEKNHIHAVAGLPSNVPGYKEAIWNEFGWTPHGTNKLVKRPLFIPLAEIHLRELNLRLRTKFSRIKLKIRIHI